MLATVLAVAVCCAEAARKPAECPVGFERSKNHCVAAIAGPKHHALTYDSAQDLCHRNSESVLLATTSARGYQAASHVCDKKRRCLLAAKCTVVKGFLGNQVKCNWTPKGRLPVPITGEHWAHEISPETLAGKGTSRRRQPVNSFVCALH